MAQLELIVGFFGVVGGRPVDVHLSHIIRVVVIQEIGHGEVGSSGYHVGRKGGVSDQAAGGTGNNDTQKVLRAGIDSAECIH